MNAKPILVTVTKCVLIQMAPFFVNAEMDLTWPRMENFVMVCPVSVLVLSVKVTWHSYRAANEETHMIS